MIITYILYLFKSQFPIVIDWHCEKLYSDLCDMSKFREDNYIHNMPIQIQLDLINII